MSAQFPRDAGRERNREQQLYKIQICTRKKLLIRPTHARFAQFVSVRACGGDPCG